MVKYAVGEFIDNPGNVALIFCQNRVKSSFFEILYGSYLI